MAVINTNSLSLKTQTNLNTSQAALGSAIGRLSSGLRINGAKDDAAGQSIANRMTSSIGGQAMAARNANDGISLSQTAEGALSEINNNLQRIRDLTVQAQNGSNSASYIDAIQSEVNQRMQEINRVTRETDFNGSKILATGAKENTYPFQVGADDGQIVSISMKSSDDWNLAGAGKNSKELNTADTTDQKINGNPRTVPAEGFDVLKGHLKNIAPGQNSPANLGYQEWKAQQIKDKGIYNPSDYPGVGNHFKEWVQKQIDEVGGYDPDKYPGPPVDPSAPVTPPPQDSVRGPVTPLADIDVAIKSVDNQRALLGAAQNRFESTIANLNSAVNNLSAARSRIQDADYSTEVSNMSRA